MTQRREVNDSAARLWRASFSPWRHGGPLKILVQRSQALASAACHGWFCHRKTARHISPFKQLSEGSFQVPLAEGNLFPSTQGCCHYSAAS